MFFRKNKKGFTLVELIVVIAIIAILGAVVGVTVSTFVNRAKKTAATTAIEALAGYWDLMEDNDTVGTFIKENFKSDELQYVKISDDKVLTMKKSKIISDNKSFTIYYHDDNCGDYYGYISFASKKFTKTDNKYAVAKDDATTAKAYTDAKAVS